MFSKNLDSENKAWLFFKKDLEASEGKMKQ